MKLILDPYKVVEVVHVKDKHEEMSDTYLCHVEEYADLVDYRIDPTVVEMHAFKRKVVRAVLTSGDSAQGKVRMKEIDWCRLHFEPGRNGFEIHRRTVDGCTVVGHINGTRMVSLRNYMCKQHFAAVMALVSEHGPLGDDLYSHRMFRRQKPVADFVSKYMQAENPDWLYMGFNLPFKVKEARNYDPFEMAGLELAGCYHPDGVLLVKSYVPNNVKLLKLKPGIVYDVNYRCLPKNFELLGYHRPHNGRVFVKYSLDVGPDVGEVVINNNIRRTGWIFDEKLEKLEWLLKLEDFDYDKPLRNVYSAKDCYAAGKVHHVHTFWSDGIDQVKAANTDFEAYTKFFCMLDYTDDVVGKSVYEMKSVLLDKRFSISSMYRTVSVMGDRIVGMRSATPCGKTHKTFNCKRPP